MLSEMLSKGHEIQRWINVNKVDRKKRRIIHT